MKIFRLFLWLTFLTGVAYPLVITILAQLAFNSKAGGDLVSHNGKVIGSALIGQKFESDKYFWPRPSAVDYNPLPSGGSNLGSTSAALKKAVSERRDKILKGYTGPVEAIPSELLYASGSGLDPHISLEAAYFQVDRIVKSRALDPVTGKKKLEALIDQMATKRALGFIGEPYVNVLLLNKDLDSE